MKSNQPSSGKIQESSHLYNPRLISVLRAVIVLLIGISIYHLNTLQYYVNKLWAWLLMSPAYNSCYFETWFATICYTIIIPVYPFAVHYIKAFDRYKINPSVTYIHTTVFIMIKDAILYMLPLMLLDTFIVKKYAGVNPSVWEENRKYFIQTTRGLPFDPPTVGQLVLHLIASIIVYDALFFFIHFILHKNMWLYKHIHSYHHKHDVMHAHLTNQLTVTERIMLILSANVALKCFNSHPLTRTVFVPVFILMLVDNHTGYDLPFGLHRIIPFNLMGGPAAHHAHHLSGAQHYQPFLTYLDKLVLKTKLSS